MNERLTDEELRATVVAALRGQPDTVWKRFTHEHGIYEITRLNVSTELVCRAIESAVLARAGVLVVQQHDEGWHAPGIGEVHNADHSLMVYCEKKNPNPGDDADMIVDDDLARRVRDLLAAPQARQPPANWRELLGEPPALDSVYPASHVGEAATARDAARYEQDLWLRDLFALIQKWRDTRDGTPSKAEAWSALWTHAHNIGPHWRAREFAALSSTPAQGDGEPASAAGLTLDANDTRFLAARLRRLFAHFGIPVPGADDDARLIGSAGAAIGLLLTRHETAEPAAWVNGDELRGKANATIACGAERRWVNGHAYDTPLYTRGVTEGRGETFPSSPTDAPQEGAK